MTRTRTQDALTAVSRWVPWPAGVIVVLLSINALAPTAGETDPETPTRTDPAVRPDETGPTARFVPEPPVPAHLIPKLRLPFPRGVVVQCTQGNNSADGHTHSLPQNLHALDFANRVALDVPIVAAAAGTVAYVVDDATEDPDSGAGYGNQVRVRHEYGLFTLYSHLDRVDVKVGDTVAAGQQLGMMGKTGLAGDRHLHFSLHHGVVTSPGVPHTLEIPALLAQEMTPDGPRELAYIGSGEVRCSASGDPWSGEIYGSENGGGTPVLGPTPLPLAIELETAAVRLREAAERRTRLWRFSLTPRSTPAAARRFLEPYLAQHPGEPVVHYAWAVEVEMPGENWREALAHLETAERLARTPRLYEPWIHGWIENQRGAIALARHRRAQAELHFTLAFGLYDRPEVAAFGQAKLMAADTRGLF